MRSGLLVLAAILLVSAWTPSHAQVPTAEQLELLRSMSPEDRAALMEQLGVGGGVGDTGSTDSTNASGGRNRSTRNPNGKSGCRSTAVQS